MDGNIVGSVIYSGVGVDNDITSDHVHHLTPYSGLAPSTKLEGPCTGTQPVQEPVISKGGNHAPGFGMLDWYDRIHVYPTDVELGNLLTSQQRPVTTWNGYVTPVSLNGIQSSNTEGVTLTGNFAFPVVYAPLEVKTYTLVTDVTGPPSIDAGFQFAYSTGQVIVVSVTGKRVVVFPFMPQRGLKESLEWKTDVIKSKSSEQRIMVRYEPRQGFEYDYFLDDNQYARWRALAYGWSHCVFAFPVWTEFTKLGQLVVGTTTLAFSTENADYRTGDVLIIWESDRLFETCEIDSIEQNQVTLSRPTVGSYNSAYVAPLRFGRTLDGLYVERGANKLIKGSVRFSVTDNKDLSDGVGLPTYRGIDVLTDTMYKVGSYSEKVMRDVVVIDNGIATPVVASTRTFTEQMLTVSWACRTRAELWRVRKWLHSRKGRAKPFWLPAGLNDFELVADASSSASLIRVAPIGYSLYYGARDIQIKLKDGTTLRNRVLSGAVDGYGTETLTLENSVGLDLQPSQVEYVCLMHLVRFDSDRIEISYDEDNTATISVPCTEVPS